MSTVRRGHQPTGYLTATQAKKRLGDISDGKFRGYISAGKVARFVPPGSSQGFYPREEVEKLAREIESPFYGASKPVRFRQATQDDIAAIADIDERTFNAPEDAPEARNAYLQWTKDTYTNWLRKNPQTFFVALNDANKVVAFASLIPMKKDTLDRFVQDEIKWMDITGEDIELYQPGRPLHLYVVALCVDPIYKKAAKKRYGAILLNNLFDFILSLANNGVEIATLTARNELNKPDGRRLLQQLGMPQLRSPVPHMHLFSVRMAESGYPLFVQYYDTLTRWKREHNNSNKEV